MHRSLFWACSLLVALFIAAGLGAWRTCTIAIAMEPSAAQTDETLVGHWKLRSDCKDHSGQGNHAVNQGVDLTTGTFNGRGASLEVPAGPSLKFGTGDFTLSVWVNIPEQLDDVVGDVLELYDPDKRRGITLSISASAGGYQSQGDDHHVHFGIDNAKTTEWQDCGRPNPKSNYVANSLTVFDGHLYAATVGGEDPADWAHVYRYEGDGKWTDCGRVGDGRTPGVVPLIVHKGDLYAVTCTYDWTRVYSPDYGPGRVYRYAGGTNWEDCGQPGDDRTFNCIASYRGKLFVGGGPKTWAVYTQSDAGDASQPPQWEISQQFPKRGPRKCFPHTMCRFNDKLYVAFSNAYGFDGEKWTYAGVPSPPESTLQTHSLTAFQGKLCAGTWPEARVAVYEGGETWHDIGRVGVDGTEVNSLVVYNGKLYGGSLPRSEVCRYDGQEAWTSLVRFYSPPGWTPVAPGENGGDLNEWSRLTSLTIYDGKLFASTGNCTSNIGDSPLGDSRGKVFCMEAGKCVSYDRDLGTGWKHLAAVRERGRLKLYIDGKLVAESAKFDPADYDLSVDTPLRIGAGQSDTFAGRMTDVRVYRRALSPQEVAAMAAVQPQ